MAMSSMRPQFRARALLRLRSYTGKRSPRPSNPLNGVRSSPAPALYSTTAASRHASPRSPASPLPVSTVDQTEVHHFNALASSWWDFNGPSRLLHLMNPFRHTFIKRCLASQADPAPTHKLRYLDIGCGGGIFAESAARLPNTASVTAIDPSPEVLEVAKKHAKQDPLLQEPGRLTYLETSIERLPRPQTTDEQYDIVSLFEVIEHVSEPSAFLEQILPHVKPGGWLVVSTIARTWTSWFTTKFVAEDVIRMVPQGTHDWAKYINEEELREWFTKREGWENPRAMGIMYVPGLGWKEISGGEKLGNYFFAIRKQPAYDDVAEMYAGVAVVIKAVILGGQPYAGVAIDFLEYVSTIVHKLEKS